MRRQRLKNRMPRFKLNGTNSGGGERMPVYGCKLLPFWVGMTQKIR